MTATDREVDIATVRRSPELERQQPPTAVLLTEAWVPVARSVDARIAARWAANRMSRNYR